MTAYKRFIIFGLLCCLFGFQCKSIHNSKSQKAMYKSIYIDQFKLTYFRKLLVKSYNNSKAVQEIINQDHSGFTELILTMEDYRLIDSLTEVDIKTMQADSANSIGRVAEGAEGKHPIEFILDKHESKWLESLANKRYKRAKIRNMFND